MDDFQLPEFGSNQDKSFAWDENKAKGKVIKTAQFLTPENDTMLAVAMKNYWLFQYVIKKNK